MFDQNERTVFDEMPTRERGEVQDKIGALALDEGRDGEWNRGRPPRARLDPAVLCARAATRRHRNLGSGGQRMNAERDEKVAVGGIAAAVFPASWLRSGAAGGPSPR